MIKEHYITRDGTHLFAFDKGKAIYKEKEKELRIYYYLHQSLLNALEKSSRKICDDLLQMISEIKSRVSSFPLSSEDLSSLYTSWMNTSIWKVINNSFFASGLSLEIKTRTLLEPESSPHSNSGNRSRSFSHTITSLSMSLRRSDSDIMKSRAGKDIIFQEVDAQ